MKFSPQPVSLAAQPIERIRPNKEKKSTMHTQHKEKLNCSRVLRQKLSSGRPCIPALPGTHNWLASPLWTALLNSPCNYTAYYDVTSYIITILEVWVGLSHVRFNTPCCPYPCAHGTDSQPCTQTPPLPNVH
eukprot:1152004-Pelagomonas_calceolata.AAC.3